MAIVLVPTALVLGASPVWATPPTVSSILPTSGPGGGGGTNVTITGANFCASPTVTIGSTAATSITVVSTTSITAVTPTGIAGAQDVVVNCGGTDIGTGTALFTYIAAPTVTSLNVVAGSVAGGTAVTATGTGFTNGTVSSVTIGGVSATSVVVATSTTLSFVTPVRSGTARKAGPVPVVVTTTLGGYSTGATTFLFRPLLGSDAKTVTNKALTSNVATITTSSAHGLLVDQTAYVTGVDSTFNGTYVVTGVPTTTTFTYDVTSANVTSASSSGSVGIGAPVPVTGVATTASATATNNGLVILGDLAAASQRKAVTNTPTGGASDPSTRAGTYSAGTSVAAGTAYSYVTDQYYDPTTAAYGYESDERTISSNFTTTVNTGASYSSRTGVYGMTSGGNCNTAPNGSTTPSTRNTKDSYETYCAVFGPQVFSEVFYATSDQALSFDWAAQGTSDDYEIYGYLVKVPSLTDVTATSSDHTIAAHGLGDTSVWTTESAAIPSNGFYRFRFVNGTYDATGGLAVGSNMFISPVVVVAKANRITIQSIPDKIAAANGTTYPVAVNATSTEGVTVTTSPATGNNVCTVSSPSSGTYPNMVVTVTKGTADGLCTLIASQGATGDYAPASTVSQSFQFLASATAPQVTTGGGSSIADTTVTLGGSVNPRGDAVTSVTFCVGTASSLAGCTSTTASPATIAATDPTTTVSAAISGLAAGTKYYYRITAINGVGTSTGSIANFTTSGTGGGGGGGSSGGGGSGGGGSSTPTTTPLDTPTSTPSTPTAPNLDLVVSPQTTSVPPGGSQVLIGGVPVSVTAGPAPGGKGTQLTGEGWTLGMGAVTTAGAKVPLNSQGQVAATTGQFVAITGTGFAPGTLVQVFTVAPPISLGTLTVAADGSFSGRVRLPETLAPGSAIIQVNGYSPTLSIRSASLGLLLKGAASTVRRSVTVYFAANSAKLSKSARSQIAKFVASVPSKARNVAIQTVGYVQPTISRANDRALSAARARNSYSATTAKVKKRFSKVKGISSGLGRATIKGPLGRKAIITISFTRP